MAIHRPPEFEKIVLERGAERAAHVASAGGLQMASMEAHQALRADDRGWLAEHGVEWGPDGAP